MSSEKRTYEELLVQQAYKSAKGVASAKKKKYAEIRKAVAVEQEAALKESARTGKKSIESWNIGFTPKNLASLIKVSGAKSNTAFYQKYQISKTVFYSYLRGETSPTYKAWVLLVNKVAEDNNATEKNRQLLRHLAKTKLD